MKLLPALSETTKRACLWASGSGPSSVSYYAWIFSHAAGRRVSENEALAIIDEANFREWVKEGCPQRTTYGDLERFTESFWSSQRP